ncbi:MAG: NADH-quinone oxidoreductase subunit K [Chloroflexi bacterium]|nr:NADH-quinone oxidoreductase subunit K [Chloroflexota bacterium]
MNLVLALAVAVLFGVGSYLLLHRDLIRVVAGVVMISNAANLLLMASGLARGSAPIYPLSPASPVSDPLVQALTLTAIVISFGATAFLLCLVYRVYASHRSLDQEALERAEERDVALADSEQRVP